MRPEVEEGFWHSSRKLGGRRATTCLVAIARRVISLSAPVATAEASSMVYVPYTQIRRVKMTDNLIVG